MAKELKDGVYIAQGPDTNILIRVVGKAPLLEIVGAINLNKFYQTGKVESLPKDSIEVLDILSCPEKYCFENPSLTSVVESKTGLNEDKGRQASDVKDPEYKEFLTKYQYYIEIYGQTEAAKNRMVLWLAKEKGIAISQGRFIITKLIQMLNIPR